MRDNIFIPEHQTNIIPLRWLANYIFEPISSFFLNLYLRWGTVYSYQFEDNLETEDGWNEDPITGDAWRLINK
jgi:hypothetical protein